MNVDRRSALMGAMAVLFLLFIVLQTRDALRRSGAWSRTRGPGAAHVDPYAGLDRQLEAAGRSGPRPAARDPFSFAAGGPVIVRADSSRPRSPRRPDPVLTAIVSDEADPRALIRYEDRNYSVKTGDLFAEFMVVSVTKDEVVLDGGGRSLVLRRPVKGDRE